MSEQLVFSKNKEAYADSRVVAKKFNIQHARVMTKIDKIIAKDSKIKIGNVAQLKYHKIDELYKNRKANYYLMDKQAFSMLVMEFNGKEAFLYKRLFINAFFEMERLLLQAEQNQTSEQWLGVRKQVIATRANETDIIKEFVEYATNQGSTKANYYYANITKATYRALGYMQQAQPKLRETLDIMQLSQLVMAEVIVSNSLQKLMADGEHYKAIYYKIKDELLAFADNTKLTRLN